MPVTIHAQRLEEIFEGITTDWKIFSVEFQDLVSSYLPKNDTTQNDQNRKAILRMSHLAGSFDTFINFLKTDYLDYLTAFPLDFEPIESAEEQFKSILEILEAHKTALDNDLRQAKDKIVNHRPKNISRENICTELIALQFLHTGLQATLSRDETPTNLFISYGLKCTEGKGPPVEQIYPIIAPIVKWIREENLYEVWTQFGISRANPDSEASN